MSSERADQPATPDNQHGRPGQVLAAQREAMGWSVEQVADQLKLAVRQVVALEAGDYASLPSPAVTRGFVRAYAKLMKMDPAPLVSQIAMDTPPAPDTSAATAARRPAPASFSASKFPSHGKRSSLPWAWIGGAVAVVAVAAAAWQFGLLPFGQRADNSVAAPGVATPAATPGVATPGVATSEAPNGHAVETLQNPAVPLISVPAPGGTAAPAAGAPSGAAAQATGPVVNVPSTTAAGAPPATAPAPAATPAASLGNVAGAAPATAGANALVLNVREDSWIEVRPTKGGPALISRLVKGGSTETFNVDQPVRMVVGNPTGVSATLRGTAVALPAVPGKTLARVNLQ